MPILLNCYVRIFINDSVFIKSTATSDQDIFLTYKFVTSFLEGKFNKIT
jgi:hypothetical protein